MAETRPGSDKQTRPGYELEDAVVSWLIRDLVFIILQFLEEEAFKETVHKLEQESGLYFNMKHFEEAVLGGEWDEVDKYLSSFTHVDDNRFSTKMFFEIRKQMYLEALDKRDRSKAYDILMKDLKVLLASDEDVFKEMMQLLTLDNFRENEKLSKYGDMKSARGVMMTELKKFILVNPKLKEKLQFPNLESSRLRTLINQSLNWQHNNCKNPSQKPDIRTLFYDHLCYQPNGPNVGGRVPSPAPPFMNVMPKAGGFPQMAPHRPVAALVPSPNASNATQMAGGFPQMAPHRPVAAPVPSPNASNATQIAGGFPQMAPHGPAAAPLPSPLVGCMTNASNATTQMAEAFPQMAPHGAFQPAAAPLPSPCAGWMTNAPNATQMAGGFSQMAPHGAFQPFQPAAGPLPSPLAGCTANASNAVQMAEGFPQMAPHGPATALLPSPLAGCMANASNATQMAHPVVSGAVSGAPLSLSGPPNTAALLKRLMTPPSSNPVVDYPSADSEHVLKRPRPMGISDDAGISSSHMPVGYPGIARTQYSIEELPKNLAVVLNQGSSVTSMDFHPSQPTVLLVGTNVGDIAVWEVSSRERLAHRNFKVWDLQACSMLFQSALAKDPAISVMRVRWNPDGSQFGVAYSKHLVHLYNYNGRDDLIQHLEIDAHVGGVNDIAFSQPNKQLCVVTCGDDKTVKVWDAVSGVVQYTFEGHEAAVSSICPHSEENIQFILSTSLDGKIKAWLYENGGSRVDYKAPGHSCTTMAYSADGTRLFSCGTSKEGDTYIVEWNAREGSVKRTFIGCRKRSAGIVQLDTTKNRFLAAGDEFVVKFWDMDNTNLLTTTDAQGGLPANPRLRFNKLGSLLAVSTSDNCIKVLANADGFRMLRSLENRYNSAPRSVSEAFTKASALRPLGSSGAMAGTSVGISDRSAPVPSIVGLQNGDSRSIVDVEPRIDASIEKSKICNLAEIIEPSQCCSLKLPDDLLATKVSRLIYTNSGMAVLALTSNAVHKLWKWQKTDRHIGKATALVPPQLWQPSSGILMTNETSDVNPEEAIHCFELSKNDAYVMSASGGTISLFNIRTFKTMMTLMPPPPAATFLAFHPQDNNTIAIGMDDSSIQIYNILVDEVKSKLRGHQKRITGLAFSNALNVLVSSGADAQLCVWGIDGWDKQTSKFLQIPSGQVSGALAETRVQFHHDQVNFLVVHETQLAIYEAAKLKRLKQWTPREASITHATYSCDSQMVYTSFTDGSVGIFSSALQLRCHISPTAYINSQPSSSVYPVVVAAHPSEPNQFAVGLTDGSVQVLEPLESDRKWGTDPPPESSSVGNASSS